LNLTEKFAVLRPAFALSFDAMLDLLLIIVVLLLIFGAGKVRSAGSDLGAAVRGFRKGVRAPEPPPAAGAPDAEFPEVVAERAQRSGKPGA
jgi:sec-independent protein translocase protein TatA